MGSDSDLEVMQEAARALKLFGITTEMRILSAHRTPEEVSDFAKGAFAEGFQVLIAGAGGAAHLPGMLAAHTEIPVIGVPVPLGHLKGEDALLSIVQMPRGVPVATVAIGNAFNAGILAVQMIGIADSAVHAQLKQFKADMRSEVQKKDQKLRKQKI